MKIISRADAKAQNLRHYYTNKPCKYGHLEKRFVGNGNCMTCSTLKNKRAKQYRHEWHKKNIDTIKKKKKIYRLINKIKIRESKIKYVQDNIETEIERRKLYYINNKERIIKNARKHRRNNPEQYIVRDLLKRLLNNWKGGRNKAELKLGYTLSEFKIHISSLFVEGMTWDNHGEWHIDHIVPVSWWLKNDVTEPSHINALINLQPLWAIDNLRKSDKI